MNTLKCLQCKNEYSASDILYKSHSAIIEIPSIDFVCPVCKKHNQILIEKNKMSNILSLPMNPDWKIVESIKVDKLDFRQDSSYLHCWLDNKHFEFKKK